MQQIKKGNNLKEWAGCEVQQMKWIGRLPVYTTDIVTTMYLLVIQTWNDVDYYLTTNKEF